MCEREICNGRRAGSFSSSSSESRLADESESASPSSRAPSRVLARGRRRDEALLPLYPAASGDGNVGRLGVDFD